MVCGKEKHGRSRRDPAFEQQQREQDFVGSALVPGLNEEIAKTKLFQWALPPIDGWGRDDCSDPVE